MRSAGGLFEIVTDPGALHAAMRRAARGKRDRPGVRRFVNSADVGLPRLRAELLAGDYRPLPYSQFQVLDPKPRTISCADFRDRVVHHAVCGALAPVIDRRLVADNFACRTGKGSHRALHRAMSFARRHTYFLKTDVRRYYDSVDHGVLLAKLARLVRERRLLALLETIVLHPVPGQAPGKGLPIGNLTSQWFANLYLDEVDHWLKEERRVRGYIRYMDDLALWADSKAFLCALAGDLDARLRDRLRLELKREGTFVAPVTEGMPFLGFRVYPRLLRHRASRLRRRRRLLRAREAAWARGEISSDELAASARAMDGARRFLGFGAPLVRR